MLVRSVYITNLDRVMCTGKYVKVNNPLSTGNYQSCDIDCHTQCVGGCNEPNSALHCMDCENHKFYFSESRFNCIESCGELPLTELDLKGDFTVRTGEITVEGQTYKGFMDGERICRLCHEECAFGCVGITNKDCINTDMVNDPENMGCKTVQVSGSQIS